MHCATLHQLHAALRLTVVKMVASYAGMSGWTWHAFDMQQFLFESQRWCIPMHVGWPAYAWFELCV
jgi:hypothetical protein